MENETIHLGPYMWTRGETPRPMRGSEAHLANHKDWLRQRAENLSTPEGKAWLKKHGFTQTKSEDLGWLTEAGLI